MDSKKALDRRDFLKAAGAMGALFGLGARGFSAELAAARRTEKAVCKICDTDMVLGRAVANRDLGPKTGGGVRLLRAAFVADKYECRWLANMRAYAGTCQMR